MGHAAGGLPRLRRLMADGRAAEALSLIAAALRLNARSADAHADYGVVLAELGRDTEAVESFDRALTLDPGHAGALAGRAHLAQRDVVAPLGELPPLMR